MKYNFSNTLLLCFCLIFLASCTSHLSTVRVSSAGYRPNDQLRSGTFYAFMKGEETSFKYIDVSYLNATGEPFHSSHEVLIYLKHRAWVQGANGLLNTEIKKEIRQTGWDGDSDPIYEDVYVARAQAVKIEESSHFLEMHQQKNDIRFIDQYEHIQHQINEAYESSEKATKVLAVGGVVIFLAATVFRPRE